jgi:hypothetical protein
LKRQRPQRHREHHSTEHQDHPRRPLEFLVWRLVRSQRQTRASTQGLPEQADDVASRIPGTAVRSGVSAPIGCAISPSYETKASTVAATLSTMMSTSNPGADDGGRPTTHVPLYPRRPHRRVLRDPRRTARFAEDLPAEIHRTLMGRRLKLLPVTVRSATNLSRDRRDDPLVPVQPAHQEIPRGSRELSRGVHDPRIHAGGETNPTTTAAIHTLVSHIRIPSPYERGREDRDGRMSLMAF